MPGNIRVIKFKVRRGTNIQRERVVLDQGELGYTTDTRRLFVGDGVLSGGHVVGTKNHGVFALKSSLGSIDGVQINDIGYADSKLYTLTADSYDSALSGWAYIGNQPDNVTIEFDNNNSFSIKLSSITADYLTTASLGNGIANIGGSLAVDYNTSIFEISSTQLSIKSAAIGAREVNSSALSSGLIGGNGTPIKVNIGSTLRFDNGAIEVGDLGSQTVRISSIKASDFGDGFTVSSGTLIHDIATVNPNHFTLSGTQINLVDQTIITGFKQNQFVSVNNAGIVTSTSDMITQALTATALSSVDGVPVGAILPHAAAIGQIPANYLLCDGATVSKTTYSELYEIIGTQYNTGGETGTDFRLPSLTGGNVLQYGTNELPSASTQTLYVSSVSPGTAATTLSAVAVNYIIKASNTTTGLFNGAPNQVSKNIMHSGTIYQAVDFNGSTVSLSSAGFLAFRSGSTELNDDTYDRFAIPVFTY